MKHFALLAFLFIIPATVQADEAALYAPAPPADAAFVRVINVTDSQELNISIGAVTPPFTDEKRVSDYAVVKQGEHTVTLDGSTESLTLEASNYYSVAVTSDKELVLIKDIFVEDPTKAALYFYNFTSAPASLVSPSYGATLFEKVESNTGTSRDINAVSFDLAIKDESDETLATLDKVELKRRQGTSIIILENADAEAVVITLTNKVAL